jgi:hypothetical protein
MTITQNNIATVIFSKDRPSQLDTTLTTYEKYSLQRNINNEFIIYKTANERFEKAYKQVAKEHPNFKFIKETTFKINLYECIKNKKHVLFLVDDCIFTRYYSIKTICTYLDICEGTLGFSLRLGDNTKHCYPLGIENNIPYMQSFGGSIQAFSWKEAGQGDFSYPLEVSSSVYRVSDIKPIIEGIHYSNPNQLEWVMYNYIPRLVNKPFLLCYETSVAFCNPINRIQEENTNRVGINPNYSIENLLVLYEAGYRINSDLFDGYISNGAHEEVDIDFISPNDNNKLGLKDEYR